MKVEKTTEATVQQVAETLGFGGETILLDVSAFVPEKSGLLMDPNSLGDCFSTLVAHSREQLEDVMKVLVSPSDYEAIQSGAIRRLVVPDEKGNLVLWGVPIESSDLVPENVAIALPIEPSSTVFSVEWEY